MSKKRIQRLKDRLSSGNLSQQQAEQVRQEILSLGGKVNLTNFGYNTSSMNEGTSGTPSTDDVANLTNAAKPIKDPGSVYEADVAGEQAESAAQINFQNPNVTNPFGSSKTTLNPDGTVSVDQSLSGQQQGILDRGTALTTKGMDQATSMLGGYSPFQMGDFNRANIEDAVYQRLMRGSEQNYNQTREEKEQELFNKGIPYSSDPNSRFQRELGDIDRRYDEQRLQARAQATAFGGQELQGEFGRGLSTHQQYMSDMGGFQGMGTGLQVPNFQQYQGPNYDVADPSSYIYAGKELQQGNKEFNLQKNALAQEAAIANKQLAMASAANQPQAPQPPAFP